MILASLCIFRRKKEIKIAQQGSKNSEHRVLGHGQQRLQDQRFRSLASSQYSAFIGILGIR